MAHEQKKKKKKKMKKTIKFMAEGQRLKVQGASFIANRGHNVFYKANNKNFKS